jgi:hypothetical protein
MILIAHRGNLDGPNPSMENHPDYIDAAINAGFHVEVDLWGHFSCSEEEKEKMLQEVKEKNPSQDTHDELLKAVMAKRCRRVLELGHDKGQYPVDAEWLITRARKLFIHVKNYEAMFFLEIQAVGGRAPLRYFFHERERYSLIANTMLVWCHDFSQVNSYSVVPLLGQKDIAAWDRKRAVFGICSDYVKELKGAKT